VDQIIILAMNVSNYNNWLWYFDKVGLLLENVSSKFNDLHDLSLLQRAFLAHELL
jgi:hypothetical protein